MSNKTLIYFTMPEGIECTLVKSTEQRKSRYSVGVHVAINEKPADLTWRWQELPSKTASAARNRSRIAASDLLLSIAKDLLAQAERLNKKAQWLHAVAEAQLQGKNGKDLKPCGAEHPHEAARLLKR